MQRLNSSFKDIITLFMPYIWQAKDNNYLKCLYNPKIAFSASLHDRMFQQAKISWTEIPKSSVGHHVDISRHGDLQQQQNIWIFQKSVRCSKYFVKITAELLFVRISWVRMEIYLKITSNFEVGQAEPV